MLAVQQFFRPSLWLLAVGLAGSSLSAAPGQDARWPFPCPTNDIARYVAARITEPVRVDGNLDEACWQVAQSSPRFGDILNGRPVIHDTRAMVVWDDERLYVAYRAEEPFVHARFTNHNDLIWQDNDLEFFIAGPDAYYEFEINAFNTSYEVLFLWEDAWKRGVFPEREFPHDKLQPFNGVGFTTHPRGGRLGHFSWTFPGLTTAVKVDGTVNEDSDRDRGWTVELALPWKGMKWLATDGRSLPPRHGDVWRMDFSRFNTYKEAAPSKDSGGWVWTTHGIWDSHIPECFVLVTFSTNKPAGVNQREAPR